MKIIFSTGWAEKALNANTKIVHQIADELSKRGHQCIICGVCTDRPGIEKTAAGTLVNRLPAISPVVKASQLLIKLTEEKGSVAAARSRMIKKHPFSAAMLFVKYHRLYEEKIEQPRYAKQLKKLTEEFKPDGIICTCNPVVGVKTVMNSGIDTNKYIWQMDPWGLHKLYATGHEQQDIAEELAAFEQAQHIFTTTVLYEQYLSREDYGVYKDKLSPAEFPNVKPYTPGSEKSPVEFDNNCINLLFCGTISDDIRDPEKLLKDIVGLGNDKIKLYFMGTGESKALNEYREKYPETVIKNGRFSSRQAFAAMEKADILVNISNVVDNMVPSKIFDYFSMGKPIVNLQKISNCPSRRYFDKYPLAFTIEDFSDTDTAALLDFIENSKGKNVPYDKVEQIYRTATVNYVASQIENTLSDNK